MHLKAKLVILVSAVQIKLQCPFIMDMWIAAFYSSRNSEHDHKIYNMDYELVSVEIWNKY
jgi:hypothetical protein